MEKQFAQAANEWDLERLYKDLADAKQQVAPHKKKVLTEVERVHLRGLLCDCSPADIAQKRYVNAKGVEVELSHTLYRYTEQLTGRPLNTIKNWRDVIDWLEEAGYRVPKPPIGDVDTLVQKVRQHCHDKIQMLYGKMQLLDISQPVDIDNLYVDVNILEEITSYQWQELSDLLQGFNPAADDFDRLGLGKVRQKRV